MDLLSVFSIAAAALGGFMAGRIVESSSRAAPLTTTSNIPTVDPPAIGTAVRYFDYPLSVVSNDNPNGYDSRPGALCQYKRLDGHIVDVWFTAQQFDAIFGRQLAAARGPAER